MKIKQIITEADFDPGIKKALQKAGYKFIKGGQDQDTYFAPDGSILKIFGTGGGASVKKYSKAQQSFIDFAQYCMANPTNPFLPTFGGVERFIFNGNYYLQISTERLFDFDKQKAGWLADQLEYMVESRLDYNGATANSAIKGIKQDVEPQDNLHGYDAESDDNLNKLVLYVGGEENLQLLIQSIIELKKMASNKGYRLDLHAGNFMLASDGNIVINDPFFTGSWRGDASNNSPMGSDSRRDSNWSI
jgi:hypothetical protein